ncbi:T9SS type A sorting domain-containing protein [bacterium]|nr:T9SS type A sorting domain-containing protein [bacterium]MBU1983142.1 T9SS type A sorting domain-containing protein [bacterium]
MKKAIALSVMCMFLLAGLALAEQVPIKTAHDVDGVVPQMANRSGDCILALGPDTGTLALFGWYPGENVKVYLDPATDQYDTLVCTPPYYPFQINSVDVLVAIWGSDSTLQIGKTLCFRVDIECPRDEAIGSVVRECHGPGTAICSQVFCYTVTEDDWAGSGILQLNVPFTGCCVDGPFFCGVELLSWDGDPDYAPAPLFDRGALLPNQNCKVWYYFEWVGYGWCWRAHNLDFGCGAGCFTGPWYLYVNGTSEAPCTPLACPGLQPRNYPGDDASDPIIINWETWGGVDIDLCDYRSDYDQRYDDGNPGGSFTGRGEDVVLSFSYDPLMTEVCFNITIEPIDYPGSDNGGFRIRSWLDDSFGYLWDGTPRFPTFYQSQMYDFTATGLGCWFPDTYYLYIDTRWCCAPVRVRYNGDRPLPVELVSFDAIAGDGQVELVWRTASESEIESWDISRNGGLIVADLPGLGDNAEGHTYRYVDRDLVNGVTYEYRLVARDIHGAVALFPMVASATPRAGAVALEYNLAQNYPNPFNPATSISYTVKEPGLVSLKIFTVDGREVATLVSSTRDAGVYTVPFNGTNLASGVYVYKLEVNGFTASRKMVLMK